MSHFTPLDISFDGFEEEQENQQQEQHPQMIYQSNQPLDNQLNYHPSIILTQNNENYSQNFYRKVIVGNCLIVLCTFANLFLWPNWLFNTSPDSYIVRIILGILIQTGSILGFSLILPLASIIEEGGLRERRLQIFFRLLGIIIAVFSVFQIEESLKSGKEGFSLIIVAYIVTALPELWIKFLHRVLFQRH